MGNLSKFSKFNNKISCSVFVHPNETCLEAFKKDLISYIFSNTKLFLPLTIVRLILKWKRINLNKIFKDLKYLFECIFFGYLIGLGCTVNICIFRNILKRFYISSIFMAALCAGVLPIYFTNVKTTRLYVITVFEVLIEIWLKSEKDIVSKGINNSKNLQTFIFMIISSVILNEQSIRKYPAFWFIKPIQTVATNELLNDQQLKCAKCNHSESCVHFFFNGLKFYGLIGLGLTFIKGLMNGNLRSLNSIRYVFKSLNFNTARFLLLYIGIYRGSYCLLNNYFYNDKIPVHKIASFLGGLSYAFYPHKVFIAYALLLLTEILWKQFKSYEREEMSKFYKFLIKYPWDRILFPFGLGIAIHFFIFHKDKNSSLCKKFVNGTTNSRGEAIRRRFELFFKN